MKLPRDIPGENLVTLLRKYGYHVTRRSGSHIRLTSSLKGKEHHITIPAHKQLKIGTLSAILTDIAEYLEMDRGELAEELFRG
ncbi:MAG: type II toxin-antitoxin system HicA family toxin [Acidobacteria bacterium]|nr:type II toxin-antitoxin system HicA family toxin [Acidobacteriota bacterium]